MIEKLDDVLFEKDGSIYARTPNNIELKNKINEIIDIINEKLDEEVSEQWMI